MYVKGDSLIAGKRYSMLLFADILQQYEREFDEVPKYILFLDCDTQTSGRDIQNLVNEIERDPQCGGLTGWLKVANSRPKSPIIPMQEYAIYHFAHVVDKAADSIFKRCTVLPGAFSLIRYSCFKECLKDFSRIPCESDIFSINLLELGEDRYLTTLLLSKGYNTQYTKRAVAYTVIPDTLSSFLTQQRRWTQSLLSNTALLLFSPKSPILKHHNWGFVQWLIICAKFSSMLLLTGTTSIVIAQGRFGHLSPHLVALGVWSYLTIFSFTIVNTSTTSTNKRVWFKSNIFLIAVLGNYGLFCGIRNAVESHSYATEWIFLMGFAVSFSTIFSFSKSGDWARLIWGFIINQFSFISTTIVIYSLSNLDERSWGTRGIVHEKPSTEPGKNIISPSLNKNAIYVKGNPTWRAAQRPGKLLGFRKKVVILGLFSLVNLTYILLLISSSGQQDSFAFSLSLFVFFMSNNIASIPSLGLSAWYHYSKIERQLL